MADEPRALLPPRQAGLSSELESITAVQKKLLARLEGTLQALSPPGLAQARLEMTEVVEELSHSGALLVTLKKELDSIYLRLRTLRQALQAAFPEQAAAQAAATAAAAQAAATAAAAQEAAAEVAAAAAVQETAAAEGAEERHGAGGLQQSGGQGAPGEPQRAEQGMAEQGEEEEQQQAECVHEKRQRAQQQPERAQQQAAANA